MLDKTVLLFRKVKDRKFSANVICALLHEIRFTAIKSGCSAAACWLIFRWLGACIQDLIATCGCYLVWLCALWVFLVFFSQKFERSIFS